MSIKEKSVPSSNDSSAENKESESANHRGGNAHPSRNLEVRNGGFGVAAGYEKPYKKDAPKQVEREKELYGPLPHAGYYGAGIGLRPFKPGQASFNEEITWYRPQFGENTSGYIEQQQKKKK